MTPAELRERLQWLQTFIKHNAEYIEGNDYACVGFTHIEYAQLEKELDAIITELEVEHDTD